MAARRNGPIFEHLMISPTPAPPLIGPSQTATRSDKSQAQQSTEIMLKQVLDRLEKLESSTTTKVKGNSSFKPYYRRGSCFICQSPDHYMKECPIYQKCQEEMQGSNQQEFSGNDNPSAL